MRSLEPADQPGMLPSSLGRVVELPKISDGRGNLTVLEGNRQVPFEIARVYTIYDVPHGVIRGCHAHRTLRQLMIASHGNFDLLLDNGSERAWLRLDRPDRGVVIGPMIWREMHNFSPGAVCLTLASAAYDEADYVRDYDAFMAAVKSS